MSAELWGHVDVGALYRPDVSQVLARPRCKARAEKTLLFRPEP